MKCKIIILGDQSVGKTSIINRLIFDNYTGCQQPTVGVDFVSKTINIGNKTLRMQIWDTAGQQKFHALIPGYIKDSTAVIVVFDVTSQRSFKSIDKWINDARQQRGDQAKIYVLGNKCDLQKQRIISKQDAQRKLINQKIKYFQVSAKSGTNVFTFFQFLSNDLAQMFNKKSNLNINQKPAIQITNNKQNKQQKQKKKSCGC